MRHLAVASLDSGKAVELTLHLLASLLLFQTFRNIVILYLRHPRSKKISIRYLIFKLEKGVVEPECNTN